MNLFQKFTGRVAGFIDDVLVPDDVRVQLLRARRALERAEYGEVLRLMDGIDTRKGGAAQIWELRGLAHLGLGEPNDAIEALRRAVSLKPSSDLFLSLASALESAEDLRGARDAYRQALVADTGAADVVDVLVGLGNVYLALGRPDKAKHELGKALRAAIGDAPEHEPSVRMSLCRALLAEGLTDEALKAIEPVLGDSDSPELLELAGNTLVRLERYEEALPYLMAAIDAGSSASCRVDAARAALGLGKPELALEVLGDGTAEAAAEPRHMTVRGRAEMASGRLKEAKDLLVQAERALPRDEETTTALAWALLRAAEASGGDMEEPEDRFVALRGLFPHSSAALHGLGRIRMARGEWQASVRLLTAAVGHGAGDEAVFDLGRVLLRSSEPGAAIETLTELAGSARDLGDEAAKLVAQAQEMLNGALHFPGPMCRDASALRQAANDLHDRLARLAPLRAVALRAREVVEAIDAPLNLAVVGEFNAGKSTLVNAFLGEDVVPVGALPTTAHVHAMTYGPQRTAILHLTSGQSEEIAISEVKGRAKQDREGTIERIEYRYPHPDLRRVHVWDTPGFNALEERHETEARRALGDADAIFWVCDASQVLSESEQTLIETVEARNERLVFIINKMDRFGDADARVKASEELIAYAHKGLGGQARHICTISAAEGLQARKRAALGHPQEGDISGIDPLIAFAEEEIFDRATALKAATAEIEIRQLRQDAGAALEVVIETYEKSLSQLEDLRATTKSWRRDFEEATCAAEAARLGDELSFLVELLMREINDALRPSAGLIDSLLTRMELDPEDVDFVLDLARRRFAGLVAKSNQRVSATLLSFEASTADKVEACALGLDPRHSKRLRARLEAYLAETTVLRRLLTERVYERYRHVAVVRSSTDVAREVITRVAFDDAENKVKLDALSALLPAAGTTLPAMLTGWATEYFEAAERFCDAAACDMKVLLIEFRALSNNLTEERPSRALG